MLIGYMRVSTKEQNVTLQKDALEAAGCEKIYDDQMSAVKERKGLKMALEVLREGDSLIVWKLDRLGRNVKDLVNMINELEQQGIHFRSLTDNIDTSTTSGRFFFHVMASLAQMERELLIERTQAGLAAARKRGRVGGRKRVMTDSKLKAAKCLRDKGIPHKDIATDLDISLPTLYRWLPASQTSE